MQNATPAMPDPEAVQIPEGGGVDEQAATDREPNDDELTDSASCYTKAPSIGPLFSATPSMSPSPQGNLLQDIAVRLKSFTMPVEFGVGQDMPSVGAVMTSRTGVIERITETLLRETDARDRVQSQDWEQVVQNVIGAVIRRRNEVCGTERGGKVDLGWLRMTSA